jgi:hypothetical protein
MPVGSYVLLKVKAPSAVDSRRFINFISETTDIELIPNTIEVEIGYRISISTHPNRRQHVDSGQQDPDAQI